MTTRRGATRLAKGTFKALRLLAKPYAGRRAGPHRGGPIGYGSRDEVFLIGRVFRQSQRGANAPRRAGRRNCATSAGASPGVRWRGRSSRRGSPLFGQGGDRPGRPTSASTCIRAWPNPRTPAGTRWSWISPGRSQCGRRADLHSSARCRRVIISDIDDTIMRTGVANKLKMLWRLFVEDAENRVAFPGAAALYRALYAGPCGGEGPTPCSTCPERPGALRHAQRVLRPAPDPGGAGDVPARMGPVLDEPATAPGRGPQRDLIEHMLSLYHDLPFVLIGDSGQHDPEVYGEIVAALSGSGRGGLYPQRLAGSRPDRRDRQARSSRGDRRQQPGSGRRQPRHCRACRRARLHRPRAVAEGRPRMGRGRDGADPTGSHPRPCPARRPRRGGHAAERDRGADAAGSAVR